MRPETTRCPLMTKDPVRPALCWKEFCELYDEETKCCSIRLTALRLGQIYGALTRKPVQPKMEKSEKRVEVTIDRKVNASTSEPGGDFKLVE